MLGMTVFALVWLRLIARWLHPAPRSLAGAGWEQALAKLMHLALYALIRSAAARLADPERGGQADPLLRPRAAGADQRGQGAGRRFQGAA